MMRTSVVATIVFFCHVASADNKAAATDSHDAGHDGEDPAGQPESDAKSDPVRLRQGLHIGFGAGGAYVPGVNASAAVLRLDFNIGINRQDLRFSPVLYYVTQPDQTTTGIGFALQHGWNIGSTYTVSIGGLFAVHHAELSDGRNYTTLAIAPMLSPVTLRLGPHRNIELGVHLMVLREFAYNTLNPAAFASLSYLVL